MKKRCSEAQIIGFSRVDVGTPVKHLRATLAERSHCLAGRDATIEDLSELLRLAIACRLAPST